MIGIFGSAFNPPTNGHYNAIKQVLNDCEEVWLIPSYKHAFEKEMLDIDKRVDMLNIFIKKFKSNKIKVYNIEKEVLESNNKNSVYTYDLLKYLENKYNKEFKFICGPDNAKEEAWKKFYNYDLIDKEFGKIIVSIKKDIRSTYVREALINKEYNKLNFFLDKEVKNYILKNNLYI